MKSMEVLSCTKQGNILRVVKEITNDDNSKELQLHIMREDTLEWRAAEYDIDPEDRDTLIDMVIYEPYLDPNDSQLYSCADRFEAKTKCLEKIRAKKNQLRRPSDASIKKVGSQRGTLTVPEEYWDERDPYDAIMEESVIDRQAIEIKKRHVDLTFQLRDRLGGQSRTPRSEELERALARRQSRKSEA